MFNADEVLQILKNVKVDLECGACMETAFTGNTSLQHQHSERRLRMNVHSTEVFLDLGCTNDEPSLNECLMRLKHHAREWKQRQNWADGRCMADLVSALKSLATAIESNDFHWSEP